MNESDIRINNAVALLICMWKKGGNCYTAGMEVVKEGKSKTGAPYIIRYPSMDDIPANLEYINTLSKEKTFIRFQGEQLSLEEEKSYYEKSLKMIEERKKVKLVLIVTGTFSGVCDIEMKDKTESHIGRLGLTLAADMRGQGLGEILMQATVDEALKHLEGMRMITLEVKGTNTIAQSLYKKLGFIEYGRLPLGSQHRGEFVDEVFMYKPVA